MSSGISVSDKRLDTAIENFGGPALERCFSVAIRAHAIDHVITVEPFLIKLSDYFGRILQVGVDDDHGVARGMFQAGGDGHLVAEISGELNDANSGVTA